MKTLEELNALKKEVETLNAKLAELTEEELEQICGGINWLTGNSKLNAEFVRSFLDELFQTCQRGSVDPEHFKAVAERTIENTYLITPHRNMLREIMMNYYQTLKK